MKVFSYKKRYAILPADDPLVQSKKYVPSDLKKFLVDTDIYQGQILKATIPAGGEIITRNRNHTIHVEKFDEQSEVYIAIDEYLWSIEFPQGASVYTEKVQETGGGSDVQITLQDKTITENGTYTPDAGFDGFGSVTVDVASSGGSSSGGAWLPAMDGGALTGEEITIPNENSAPYRIMQYLLPSDNGQYLATVNGTVYVVNEDADSSGLDIVGYPTLNGDTTLQITVTNKGYVNLQMMTASSLTCTFKLERWSESGT